MGSEGTTEVNWISKKLMQELFFTYLSQHDHLTSAMQEIRQKS